MSISFQMVEMEKNLNGKDLPPTRDIRDFSLRNPM